MNRLVIEIYEESTEYPVVTHIFTGTTTDEAESYFRAHLKTDSFLRGCYQKQRFADFKCRAVAYWL